MLKKRIIPIQLLRDGRLTKTVRFEDGRDVGDPVKSSSVYNSQYADDLILLNIDRDRRSVEPLLDIIDAVSEVCFMPLSLGGGITQFEEAAALIHRGADKVVVNSAAYRDLQIISRIADHFGSQAVIVSIDARWDEAAQKHRLFADCGRQQMEVALEEHLGRCVEAGAGEIMIQSIDRDGTMQGFDIALIGKVVSMTTVPVIGAGGSGDYAHLKDAFLETDVSALACGSLFNFSDSNPIRAKAYCTNLGLPFKVI